MEVDFLDKDEFIAFEFFWQKKQPQNM